MTTQNTTIDELKSLLHANPDLPLLFKLGGQTINPDYHVTEVKHAVVDSMDCGQGTEHWDEVIVQLLDGSARSKGVHMPCGKFIGIVSTALQSRDIDENTLVYIEFAPNNTALQRLTIEAVEATESEVIVHLSMPTAMCKPLQRAMQKAAATNVTATSCC